jgi:NADH:ubiquinone oxidoreductase subunit 4 (subunit M)
MVIPIVAMAIFMGVLPNVFLHPMEASVNRVIQRITDRQATQVQAAPATNRAPGGAGGLR